MVRSEKKGPYIAYDLLKKINKLNINNKQIIKTWSRSSTIIPEMIGHTLAIHNGQKHIPLFITDSLVGYKLGEFVPTRFFKSHKKTDRKIKHQ